MTPLLMTPGPTRIPDRVLRAGVEQVIHHRSPEFSRLLASTLDGLRALFGTTGDVLPVHATGRGAMESAICNLFSPGDELIACCNGRFGEIWAEIAERFGLTVHRVCAEWDSSVYAAEIETALGDHPRASAVTIIHSDTSTGCLNDIESVSA